MKLKNILLVGALAFISMTGNVSASLVAKGNDEYDYIKDYKTYQPGEKVTLTTSDGSLSKEFYVVQDGASYDSDEDWSLCEHNLNVSDPSNPYSYCDFMYLIEAESSINNVMAKDFKNTVASFDSQFYNNLDNDDIAYTEPFSLYDIANICTQDIDVISPTEVTKIKCPSWLGYGFFTADYDENDVLSLYDVAKPDDGETEVKLTPVDVNSEIKSNVRYTTTVHKKLVVGAKIENVVKPDVNTDKKSETVKNPQTGVSVPALILFALVIMGTVIVSKINKKDKFHQI